MMISMVLAATSGICSLWITLWVYHRFLKTPIDPITREIKRLKRRRARMLKYALSQGLPTAWIPERYNPIIKDLEKIQNFGRRSARY
jgi:hypothetical protein